MLCLSFFAVQTVYAEEPELPLWELGVGGGGFSMPQYMGSDERYNYPIAFPYIIYRGDFFRIDRGGIRGRLFDTDRISLDLSFGFGLPVRNTNTARSGMPALRLTGQVGPQLNVYLAEYGNHSWSMHLPVRDAINIRADQVGWLTEPKLRYAYDRPMNDGRFRTRIDVGAMIVSRRFNDTYYSVDPAYVRTGRPAYQAGRGLHSIFAKLRVSYPISRDIQLFSGVQVRDLGVGVVDNSPLVKSRTYTSVVGGLIWTLMRSDKSTRAEIEEEN